MTELRLRFVTGPRRGQEVAWTGPRVRIGRSRDNDVMLAEREGARSSAHHAEARYEDGAWWLVDLHSTNGTFVNGTRIDRQRLRRGDRLTLGDEDLVICGRRPPIGAIVVGSVVVAVGLGVLAYWLARPSTPALEDMAATAAKSVYAIAIEQDGRRAVIGTAFAVRADGLLATNAHVADALRQRGAFEREQAPRQGSGQARAKALAIRSDVAEDARRIVEAGVHPNWQPGTLRDDVAWLRVSGGPPTVPLPLASSNEFDRLQRGVMLATFGFPAAGTNPWKPRGRFAADVAGDIRDDRYVEVGLGIAPGMSGSPILAKNGMVVAIAAGGDFVPAADGRGAVPTGSGVNWGISVAALHELLATRR